VGNAGNLESPVAFRYGVVQKGHTSRVTSQTQVLINFLFFFLNKENKYPDLEHHVCGEGILDLSPSLVEPKSLGLRLDGGLLALRQLRLLFEFLSHAPTVVLLPAVALAQQPLVVEHGLGRRAGRIEPPRTAFRNLAAQFPKVFVSLPRDLVEQLQTNGRGCELAIQSPMIHDGGGHAPLCATSSR
jgi:hypothetical protein